MNLEGLGYLMAPFRASTPAGVRNNIERARIEWRYLTRHGLYLICPHVESESLDPLNLLGDDWWLAYTLLQAERCDYGIRLPGDSEGSDGEERRMRELGRPVYSLAEVREWLEKRCKKIAECA